MVNEEQNLEVIDPTIDITLVKMNLTLVSSIEAHNKNPSKEIVVFSGLFAGIIKKFINNKQTTFIILTKDYKDYDLYNIDYVFIMSIMYRQAEKRNLSIFKTHNLDQIMAMNKVKALLAYFVANKKTEADENIINIKHYTILESDKRFMYEDSNNMINSLLNNKPSTPSIPSIQHLKTMPVKPSITGVTATHDYSINKYNNVYTTVYTKEPLFFKRTTPKASKKMLDKMKELAIVINNEIDEVTVSLEVEKKENTITDVYGEYGWD